MDKNLKDCIFQAERFLTLREHNEKELKDKLKHKGFNEDVILKTIEFLKEEDELSEERYIRAFIRSNNSRHPESLNIILQRLAQKGADRTLSKKIAKEIYTEEYEENLASSCFIKSLKKTADEQKIKQKMVKAGFSLSKANNLLKAEKKQVF